MHEAVDVFRVALLGERGEPRDIREQDGHLLALAFERALRGEDLLRKMLGGVGLGGGEARGG